MEKNILLLASSSQSRKKLLNDSLIPFRVIEQAADEEQCDHSLPLDQLVMCVAKLKMAHVVMPSGTKEGEIAFVVTADTLSQDSNGAVHKKPVDRNDAKNKIKAARNGCQLSTAFCLEKRIWADRQWLAVGRIDKVVCANYRFIVLDHEVDYYLDNSFALQTSGAIAVEDFGLQFLEYVQGSYSAIIGLPLFELRAALRELGFFVQE